MTAFDLATECKLTSKTAAKRIALFVINRLRTYPNSRNCLYVELTPYEAETLQGAYLAEAKRRLVEAGPNLPGLEPEGATTAYLFDRWRVRVVVREKKPWFIAKDIAEALGYEWNGNKTIGHVPERWRGVESVSTPSGKQDMLTLSLEGLFYFLNRSDKPAAQPFQEWVNGEVLPSIHRTGSYTAPSKPPAKPAAPKSLLSKLPAGAQLEALRHIYGPGEAAKRVDYLIGYAVLPAVPAPSSSEPPRASDAEAEAAFDRLHDVAAGAAPAGLSR